MLRKPHHAKVVEFPRLDLTCCGDAGARSFCRCESVSIRVDGSGGVFIPIEQWWHRHGHGQRASGPDLAWKRAASPGADPGVKAGGASSPQTRRTFLQPAGHDGEILGRGAKTPSP